MRLGENNHKRPQGSHKIHYIKNFELNLNSFLTSARYFRGFNIHPLKNPSGDEKNFHLSYNLKFVLIQIHSKVIFYKFNNMKLKMIF